MTHGMTIATMTEQSLQTDIPGLSFQVLYHNKQTGALSVMVRLASSTIIPRHWHSTADETAYIVEGELSEDGTTRGPGYLLVAKPQEVHGPYSTETGCTILCSFSGGFDFYLSDEVGERRRLRLLAIEQSSLANWLIPFARQLQSYWQMDKENNSDNIRYAQSTMQGASQKLHTLLTQPGDVEIGGLEKRRLQRFHDDIQRYANLDIPFGYKQDSEKNKQIVKDDFWQGSEKTIRELCDFAERV